MIIDITTLDKKVFKRILTEENERDNITRNMIKKQIEYGNTYGQKKEFKEKYDMLVNKKMCFDNLISLIDKTNEIDVSEKEIEYFKHLIKNQKEVSKSRIDDFNKPNGCMYRLFYKQCVENGKPEQVLESVIKEIVDCEIKNIKCCEQLSKLLILNN